MNRRKRNGGIRKRCGCPKAKWPKCPHPWHMNFKWKGCIIALASIGRSGA